LAYPTLRAYPRDRERERTRGRGGGGRRGRGRQRGRRKGKGRGRAEAGEGAATGAIRTSVHSLGEQAGRRYTGVYQGYGSPCALTSGPEAYRRGRGKARARAVALERGRMLRREWARESPKNGAAGAKTVKAVPGLSVDAVVPGLVCLNTGAAPGDT